MGRKDTAGVRPIRHRPLVGAVVVFAAGIAAGVKYPGTWQPAAWVWAASVAAWFMAHRSWRMRFMRAACLTAVLASGWIVGVGAWNRRCERLDRLRPLFGRVVSVEAHIGGLPEDGRVGKAGVRIDTVLRKVQLSREGAAINLSRLSMRWYGPDMRGDPDGGIGILPHPGEQWSFSGTLHAPRMESGASPASEPLLIVSADDGKRLRKAPSWHPMLILSRFGSHLRDRLTLGLAGREESESMLAAMLLGKRLDMPPDLTRSFRLAGTYHVFAISGLHVGIIGLLGIWLMGRIDVPRRLWILFLAPLMGVFILVSGARPSAVRAGLMLFFYLLGISLERRADGLCSLAAAALMILLFDPLQVFDAGFLMSFTVVAGLIIMTGPILRRMEGRLDRPARNLVDQAARIQVENGEGGAPGGWSIRVRNLRRRVLELVAVSLAAWLSSLPLTAFFFERVSWIGFLANILMTPLAFLVVVTGCLSLLGGLFWDGLSLALNQFNWGVTGSMAALARLAASLPGASVAIPGGSWWGVLASELVLWRLVGGGFFLGGKPDLDKNANP